MSEPDLTALRARLEKTETQSRASLVADALALLSLVARLQGERDEQQKTLTHIWERASIAAGSGWGPEELCEELMSIRLAARAALGEE